MTWGFIWLMLALKIPLAGLIYIVWWAIHQEPEPVAGEDGGGSHRVEPRPNPHPRRPFPRHPRRGPHGEALPPSPQRIRAVKARAGANCAKDH